MKVDKIDVLLDLCKVHIDERKIVDGRIEALLVQGLLVSMCAEFENILKNLTNVRDRSLGDGGTRGYVVANADKAFRSAGPKNIEKTIKKFGDSNKHEFERLKNENLAAWIAYGNIISNRNDVAHGRPFHTTLKEVREFYESGHVVLDWFESALWTGNK